MEDSKGGLEPLPNSVRDEVLLAGLLMPLATTNLRAPIRPLISISDASEFGGSAAEASQFIAATDKKLQEHIRAREMAMGEEVPKLLGSVAPTNVLCSICGGLNPHKLAHCPLGCPSSFCSTGCYLKHRNTCAHAKLEREKVIILSPQKENNLIFTFISNGISVDWELPRRKRTPEAALVIAFSRGPSQKPALQQLDVLKAQRVEGRLAVLWGGSDSRVWQLRPTMEMEKSLDTFKLKGKGFALLHNLPKKCFQGLEMISKEADWSDGWKAFTLCVKRALRERGAFQFPAEEEDQQKWILDCLLNSTRGYTNRGVAAKVSDEITKLLATVGSGKEAAHLRHILQFCDFRGSEVSLRDETVNEGSRQIIPYPAIVWEWKSVQSYEWRQTHHINVLELIAFFNYLRSWVSKPEHHGCRLLHVVDSRIVSCVLAKGRSSSCKLNRVLRRVGALMLASDIYVFPLWTVSRWNFADSGSRALCPVGD